MKNPWDMKTDISINSLAAVMTGSALRKPMIKWPATFLSKFIKHRSYSFIWMIFPYRYSSAIQA